MDSGLVVYRREPIEVSLVKDRSSWSFDVTADQWGDSVGYGFGLAAETDDTFPPRPDRDVARHYEVPGIIRWVIRRLLTAGFRDVSEPHEAGSFAFRRDSVSMHLAPIHDAWVAELVAEGWPGPLTLPGFHGQSS